jgi:hypothetical protein
LRRRKRFPKFWPTLTQPMRMCSTMIKLQRIPKGKPENPTPKLQPRNYNTKCEGLLMRAVYTTTTYIQITNKLAPNSSIRKSWSLKCSGPMTQRS